MADSNLKSIAVIGTGGMGQFHARTLQTIPGVSLTVCDPMGDTAQQLGTELAAPWSTDPLATAAGGFDGVVIASPDHTHAELALAALHAGSRVLCEKPLAVTIEDAQAVVDAEIARGSRHLQIGFQREYDPAHLAVEAHLADLGPLHYLRCTHRNTNTAARTPETIIVQSVIHDIHTVRWLAGEITEVDARSVDRSTGDGMAHVLVVCRLASGATATIEFSDNTYAYDVEVEVTAERGMAMTSVPQRPRLRVDGSYTTPIGDDWFGWFADAYRAEDAAWVASLHDPAASGPSAWDGLAAQLVADATLESLRTGRPVAVAPDECPPLYLESRT